MLWPATEDKIVKLIQIILPLYTKHNLAQESQL